MATLRLRNLGIGFRMGLTGLLITMLIGYAASGLHLYWHYEPRDERPGLSINDIRSAYRGIDSPSILAESLRGGHPETLSDADRQALLSWLASDRISENYDSLDLGDDAPAEIIAMSCLSCHSRSAPASERDAGAMPLEYWNDVSQLAFAVKIEPVPLKIVAISTHTHALAMAPLTLVIGVMAFATIFPRRLVAGVFAVAGLALAADISSWWLARLGDIWVYVIATGGALYFIASVLMILMSLVELWRPFGPRNPPGEGISS